MEFLGIPVFDDDLYKMLFRFVLNIVFLTIIIRGLYYRTTRRRDYLFTYYMISIIVFFLCFTMKKFELDLGMALGLFAIFGIIRYRTDAIGIKEMTYLFVVIGVSVMNSLVNKKMSYAEILLANIIIAVATATLEYVWLMKQEITRTVVYEQIENIKPQNHGLLIKDLEERMGLEINKVEVGEVDFMRDTAKIKVYYSENSSKA